MKCPTCKTNPAIIHPFYGPVNCKKCDDQETQYDRPESYPEFTSENIKDQRREYKKDIIQPYRDGVLSKEFLETYGTQGIKPTKEQLKNAEYTWKDTKGWWQRDRSKGGRK